jgi:hypothetical protein
MENASSFFADKHVTTRHESGKGACGTEVSFQKKWAATGEMNFELTGKFEVKNFAPNSRNDEALKARRGANRN